MTDESAAAQLPSTEVAQQKPALRDVELARVGGGGMLTPKNLSDVVAFAQLMARAQQAIPKHLRDNPGACLAVTMLAMRVEMDPFAVASKSYVVNDQIAYEAQFVSALINTRANLAGRPQITFTGEGPSRQCKVTATFRGESEEPKEYETPRFDKITTKNSPLWKSDPDQQLAYFALRSWGRRHCAEVLLGVYDRDELLERRDDEDAPPTGLRARLEAKAGGEPGFSPDHVAAEFAPADAATFEERATALAESALTGAEVEVIDATFTEEEVEAGEAAYAPCEPTPPIAEAETGGPTLTTGSALKAAQDAPAAPQAKPMDAKAKIVLTRLKTDLKNAQSEESLIDIRDRSQEFRATLAERFPDEAAEVDAIFNRRYEELTA